MRKILLLLVLFSWTCHAGAQVPQKDLPASFGDSITLGQNYHIANAGHRLQRSAVLDYASIGSGVVGLVLLDVGLNIDTERITYGGFIEKDKGKKNAKIFTCAVGGVFLVSAAICEIISIKRKLDAGRSLKMYAAPGGVGMQFNY